MEPSAPLQQLSIHEDEGLAFAERRARRRSCLNTFLAALSNCGAAYNIANINLAHVVMENQYCGGDHCKDQVTIASTSCLIGAITGQLTFGYVGDCLGRACALQLTTIFTILGSLASAFVVPLDSGKPESVFTLLILARFVLGIGVGGVYPLAATMAAEGSNNDNRGKSVSLVFSMQGVGQLLIPLVGMALFYSLGSYTERAAEHEPSPGLSWRLLLGAGALFGVVIMPLNAATTRAQRPPSPMASPAAAGTSAPQQLVLWRVLTNRVYWPKLLGCAGGWFLFDITFYGNTLFAPTMLKSVFHAHGATPVVGDRLEDNLSWQLAILALIGLPGYYVSVCLMDVIGRKWIQLQGFFMMAILYAFLGAFIHSLKHSAVLLLIVYGLTYFFSNFGPNSTTFILPAETFPEEVRSSLNGFCAAAGKVGAALGSACFKPIVHAAGTKLVFYLCAVCAILGFLVTAFFVEDRRGRSMAVTGEGSIHDDESSR